MRGQQYLTRGSQYALVFEKGSSWVSRLVVIRVVPNGLVLARYGIVVSRRVGTAVVRNRVKRLLREILRLAPMKTGWDMVFIARPPAAKADYAALAKTVNALLARAQLLREKDERVCLEID